MNRLYAFVIGLLFVSLYLATAYGEYWNCYFRLASSSQVLEHTKQEFRQACAERHLFWYSSPKP